jgi:hypothetical protein
MVIHLTQSSGGPNWAEIITAIGTAVIAFGVIFAGLGWIGERRRRDAESVAVISRRWDSPKMYEIRQGLDAIKTPAEANTALVTAWTAADSSWYDYEHVLNFFEDLGSLEKCGAMRLRIIKESLGTTVVGTWKLWGDGIVALRTASGQQTMYENFQLLSDRLQGNRLRRIQRIRRFLHLKY